MQPKVSVIIVNYNVKQLLFNCLKSLFDFHPGADIEVIVIDNHSTDGSAEMVLQNFPKVTWVQNNFNAGFSGANNQGMKMAKGEYIFLLNPDTELIENSIDKLYLFHSENRDYSMIAPRLLNSDRSLQISVWKDQTYQELLLETFFLHKLFGSVYYDRNSLNQSFDVKTISGAAMFFHRSLMDSIGLLDENLFWMEDIDFSVRAQVKGKIRYYRETEIIHHSGQSQKKNYNRSIANQLISKLKFYRKYHSKFIVFTADLFCFFFILSRLIIFSMLSPVKEIYRLKAKAYFYTYHQYFEFIFGKKTGIV